MWTRHQECWYLFVLSDLYSQSYGTVKHGQASQADLLVGLKSWAVILLPRFVRSNDQSKDLILEFVEKWVQSFLLISIAIYSIIWSFSCNFLISISKKPDARTKLVNAYDLFPPPSFETLLRLTFFPASSAREEVGSSKAKPWCFWLFWSQSRSNCMHTGYNEEVCGNLSLFEGRGSCRCTRTPVSQSSDIHFLFETS